jgi:hypothetical protein
MNNIVTAIEYIKNNSHKMLEKNNNYAVQSVKMAIEALESQLNNRWIPCKERFPENKQEVLTYYYDKDWDIHQIDTLTYYHKGEILDNDILNPQKMLIAPRDGFYIIESGSNGNPRYRLHADIITHWMPMPEPPEEVSE